MKKRSAKAKPKERAQQERGKRTRENLLQAAIRSLVDSHVYGLRFAQISKIANVPQPLMDYHFPSLEILLMEMIRSQVERLKLKSIEAIEKHADKPRKALEAYIRTPFEMAENDAGFRAVWSCYYHLASLNRTFADYNRSVRITGHERIMTVVGSIVAREKRLERDNAKRLRETASEIQALITGFCFMAGAETEGNFKSQADLAVKAAAQVLESNFPLPASSSGAARS